GMKVWIFGGKLEAFGYLPQWEGPLTQFQGHWLTAPADMLSRKPHGRTDDHFPSPRCAPDVQARHFGSRCPLRSRNRVDDRRKGRGPSISLPLASWLDRSRRHPFAAARRRII